MNQSELERRLRSDATRLELRAPEDIFQRVLGHRREERGASEAMEAPARAPGWRPLPMVGALAVLAVVATLATLWLRPGAQPGPLVPPVAERQPAEVDETAPSSQPLDHAVAVREQALAAELERVRADLRRLRALVERA